MEPQRSAVTRDQDQPRLVLDAVTVRHAPGVVDCHPILEWGGEGGEQPRQGRGVRFDAALIDGNERRELPGWGRVGVAAERLQVLPEVHHLLIPAGEEQQQPWRARAELDAAPTTQWQRCSLRRSGRLDDRVGQP